MPLYHKPRAFEMLASGHSSSDHTGTLSKTTLATIPLTGGRMGRNGILRISALVTVTNNANAKTLNWDIGGVAFLQVSLASNATFMLERMIRNIESEAVQEAFAASTATSYGGTSIAPVAAAVDMSADQTLTMAATLGNTGDTFRLRQWFVEVLKQD